MQLLAIVQFVVFGLKRVKEGQLLHYSAPQLSEQTILQKIKNKIFIDT